MEREKENKSEWEQKKRKKGEKISEMFMILGATVIEKPINSVKSFRCEFRNLSFSRTPVFSGVRKKETETKEVLKYDPKKKKKN